MTRSHRTLCFAIAAGSSRPRETVFMPSLTIRSTLSQRRSIEAPPNNLPHQVTSFIGRERELKEVNQLLADTRFLTLVGPGGIGKTRLSLQAAADARDDYPDGVWFVELAPLASPRLVDQ